MTGSLFVRCINLNEWVIQDEYQDIYIRATKREKAEFVLLALHRAKGGILRSIEDVKKEFDMAYTYSRDIKGWLKIQRSW